MPITIVLGTPEYIAILGVAALLAWRRRARNPRAAHPRLHELQLLNQTITSLDPLPDLAERAAALRRDAQDFNNSIRRNSVLTLPETHSEDVNGSPISSPGRETQGSCAFLTILPPELRNQVYEHLLISDEVIVGKKQIKRYKPGGYRPAAGLDARILVSCRTIYNEAYPILYGRNVFQFEMDAEMECFRDLGLPFRFSKSAIRPSLKFLCNDS